MMGQINEANFETVLPVSARDEYWRRVKFCLRSYFGAAETLAGDLRRSIETASVAEQMLIYHRDPLATASDLAGTKEIKARDIEDYNERFSDTPTLAK